MLEAGEKYIYESPDGGKTVFARKFGTNEKRIIGLNLDRSAGEKDLDDHVMWNEIRQAARTNPALQRACENVIMLYKLVKDYERENRT